MNTTDEVWLRVQAQKLTDQLKHVQPNRLRDFAIYFSPSEQELFLARKDTTIEIGTHALQRVELGQPLETVVWDRLADVLRDAHL